MGTHLRQRWGGALTVTVRYMDMGAAAPLGAIRADQDGASVIVVHSGLSDSDAYKLVAALCEYPPAFPIFLQHRASLREAI